MDIDNPVVQAAMARLIHARTALIIEALSVEVGPCKGAVREEHVRAWSTQRFRDPRDAESA